MDRKLLITIHMYLAAFFAPAVLLVAISGGLYLAGVKGNVEQETIYSRIFQEEPHLRIIIWANVPSPSVC
jgi:hypothetical protein